LLQAAGVSEAGARWLRVILEPLRKEDPEAWLQATIPLLTAKAQASPLGEALKALAGIPFFAA